MDEKLNDIDNKGKAKTDFFSITHANKFEEQMM